MLSNSTIIYTAVGFVSGSVMYSYIIPRLICGRDVRASAADCNPGAANAGLTCGRGIGILCGVLDVMKGLIPVLLAILGGAVEANNLSLVPIMVAPMLGHAFSPMLHFRGGKAIATMYGSLLALLYWNPVGLVMAGAMIVAMLIIKNHATAVSAAALAFTVACSIMYRDIPAVKLTALIMSAVLVYKHWPETHAYMLRHAAEREHRRAA